MGTSGSSGSLSSMGVDFFLLFLIRSAKLFLLNVRLFLFLSLTPDDFDLAFAISSDFFIIYGEDVIISEARVSLFLPGILGSFDFGSENNDIGLMKSGDGVGFFDGVSWISPMGSGDGSTGAGCKSTSTVVSGGGSESSV